MVSATQVRADLSTLLPSGSYAVAVTNPDGQAATGTLTTLDGPVVDSATAVTDTNGKVHLIVTGRNFGTPGYNNDADGSNIFVQDKNGDAADTDVTIHPSPPAFPGAAQQAILTLNGVGDGSDYHALVINADGQNTFFPPVGAAAKAPSAKPRAVIANASKFQVYTKDQSMYNVVIRHGDGKGLTLHEYYLLQVRLKGADTAPLSSPTQVLLGQVSFTGTVPLINAIASGVGTSVTGLISQDGGGIVSHDSGGLISQDSGGIVSHDSGGLISQDGGGVISNDGGSIVSHDSGGVISNDGGSILPVSSLLGPIASGAGVVGNLTLNPLVAQGGGNITAHAARAQDAPAPLTFTLLRHDEGPENGTGPTDATVTLTDTGGNSTLVLDISYTPGQPDVIVYQAPGVTVSPRAGTGTPAPQISSPAPTLTALSPGKATAGTPDLTLSVTGTLFTAGTRVNWNGQPLATTVLSGTQATAVVPASLLSAGGTAQVTVTNPAPGGGVSAALPFTVIAPLHTFPAGLQMLSVTEDYARVGLGGALSDSSHTLMAWNPATSVYDIRTDLHPGSGYWVRMSKATDLYDTGTLAPTGTPFSIALQPGWNMIGDPFPTAVALSSLTVRDAIGTQGTFTQAVSGGVVSGTLYAYPAGSTQYQQVGQDGSLTPFNGYWIYAFRACTLLVPAH